MQNLAPGLRRLAANGHRHLIGRSLAHRHNVPVCVAKHQLGAVKPLVVGNSSPLLRQPILAALIIIVEDGEEVAPRSLDYHIQGAGIALVGCLADNTKPGMLLRYLLEHGC